MGKRDPRVDAYIAKSAEFARPILTTIRETVHASCPDVVEEMKWSFPHFTYMGMLCSMASFTHHAAFGFWKAELVLGRGKERDAMGHFGRLTKPSDLPSKTVLAGYVKTAAALNDAGVKVPSDLTAALKKNKKAQSGFGAMSPSHKREYVEWITGAKSDETRGRRLAQA